VGKRLANFGNALVGSQIVDNRYDYFFGQVVSGVETDYKSLFWNN
jgi:hypothetical protein